MSWDAGISQKDPDAFERLAAHLERMGADGGRRVRSREGGVQAGLDAARAAQPSWTGPRHDDFVGRVRRLEGPVTDPDLPGARDYEGLGEVAREARAVARSIREVRRVWEQLSTFEHAKLDAVQVLVGGAPVIDHAVDHPVVQEAEAQLRRWDELCAVVADELRQGRERLESLVRFAPDGRPGGSVVEETRRRQDVRARWGERVEAFVGTLGSDPERLARWWQGLDDAERAALIEQRPSLLHGPLEGLLTDAERRRLAGIRRVIGARDADELRAALRQAGLDPDRFVPGALVMLDPAEPRYRELFTVLERIAAGHGPDEGDWGVGFYGRLGVDGTVRLLAVLDMFRWRARGGATPVVARYATAFGAAAGAPELAAIRDRVVNGGAITYATPGFPSALPLEILLAGDVGRYDPGFVAQASRELIFEIGGPLAPLAYRALAANSEAARGFVFDAGGEIDQRALHALVVGRSGYVEGGDVHTTDVGPDAATALRHVIFDQHDRPRSNEVYIALIQDIAETHGSRREDVSADVKRVTAQSLVFYVDEIGLGAVHQHQDTPADYGPACHLTHQQLVRFFAELSGDEQAAAAVGAGLTARGVAIVDQVPVGSREQPAVDPDHDVHVAELRRLAFVTTAARQGFDLARTEGIDNAASGHAGVRIALTAAATLPAGASLTGVGYVSYAGQVTAYGSNMLANAIVDSLNAPAIVEAKKRLSGGNELESHVLSALNKRMAIRAPASESDRLLKDVHEINKAVFVHAPVEEAFNDAEVDRVGTLGPDQNWDGSYG
jgi:hypothetical protein